MCLVVLASFARTVNSMLSKCRTVMIIRKIPYLRIENPQLGAKLRVFNPQIPRNLSIIIVTRRRQSAHSFSAFTISVSGASSAFCGVEPR